MACSGSTTCKNTLRAWSVEEVSALVCFRVEYQNNSYQSATIQGGSLQPGGGMAYMATNQNNSKYHKVRG